MNAEQPGNEAKSNEALADHSTDHGHVHDPSADHSHVHDLSADQGHSADHDHSVDHSVDHDHSAGHADHPDGHPKVSKGVDQAQRALGQTRLIAAIPAIGLAICSFVLVVATTVDAVLTTIGFIAGEEDISTLTIEYVEFTDMYLLGVVLFMTALGLTTLFITSKIPLPSWLEFHDFDDLKERLVSVIVVMLGVHFLGAVLKGVTGIDLLWLGLGICVVIIALTAFTSAIFKKR